MRINQLALILYSASVQQLHPGQHAKLAGWPDSSFFLKASMQKLPSGGCVQILPS